MFICIVQDEYKMFWNIVGVSTNTTRARYIEAHRVNASKRKTDPGL